MESSANTICSFETNKNIQQFNPHAEDILTDEDLLELFRIIKNIIRKKPDTERIAKLYFCLNYAMGDVYQFYRPKHSNHLIFRDQSDMNSVIIGDILLPNSTSCCQQSQAQPQHENTSTHSNILSVSYLTNPTSPAVSKEPLKHTMEVTSTDKYSVRPYTNIKPLNYPYHNQPIPSSSTSPSTTSSVSSTPTLWSDEKTLLINKYPPKNLLIQPSAQAEILTEPKQRGFYYQDGRISKEPMLLQRYAEQGILTQDSLLKRRKKQDEYTTLEFAVGPAKKPKIPHRHGEFNQRRDDIINRMRSILMTELEQKAQKLPNDFTLSIETTDLPETITLDNLTTDDASKLLTPALRILTFHSNMKPHQDNGMNQNGKYYNSDYFRLYLAFAQFQKIFSQLFPHEISRNSDSFTSVLEFDKDRERNDNMKAYRTWIEPYLKETNWSGFRRNVMVGERMMQLTQIVGQGVLLMTKELSGSKLHLTFTNNEWDEFINGLSQGLWDESIDWSHENDDLMAEYRKKHSKDGDSILVSELKLKFATHFWFTEEGQVVPPSERIAARQRERQNLVLK